MRIVFDATFLSNERQAGYHYLNELIPRIRGRKGLSVEVVDSPVFRLPSHLSGGATVHSSRLPSSPKFLKGPLRKGLSKVKWALEKKFLAKSMESTQEQPALFHTFYYAAPPTSGMSWVANALDLIPELFASEFGLEELCEKQRPMKEKCFKEADRLIAISEATKRDVISFYGTPKEKIVVVPLAVDVGYLSQRTSASPIDKPYLLQVGGRLHHKNFSRLLQAFAASPIHRDYLLVSAGEPWSEAEKARIEKLGMKDRVLNVVHPDVALLRALYQGASLFVYPSLYEGFGLPVLEAMAAGVPVATSEGAGSIPEVAGDAARFFDPRDPADIAKTMEEALGRKDLIERGYRNVARFSWNRTAQETVQVYADVFRSKSNLVDESLLGAGLDDRHLDGGV